jgi:branched-subunit amino acid transport protein
VKDNGLLVAGVLILSVGTYGFRLAGQLLRTRVRFPPRAVELLEVAAVVLLTALVAVTAFTQGHGSAGLARPAGVAVAGLLAWRKAPFIVVVLAAALTTALIRMAKL